MKKLLSMTLLLALLAMPLLAQADVTKDETIYTLLAADDALNQTYIVSHIDTPEDGEYVDYGNYASVVAMLTEATPIVDGDKITWTLPANPEGFYAVGIPEAAALPYTVKVTYKLNDAEFSPDGLEGQSGKVEITIVLTPNPEAVEAFRARYVAQVQVPLSLAKVANIDAPGAASTLVGQTQTLAYTVLPGQEATYTITFDAKDFTMDGITIACAPMDIASMIGLDLSVADDQGQTSSITDGVRTLADGSSQLAGGIASLAEGTQTMADNAPALSAGVDQLATGVSSLSDGVQAMTDALGTLSASGDTITASVSQLQEGLTAMMAAMPEEQRMALEGQLTALVEGLGSYTKGVSTLATQSVAISEGAAALVTDNTTEGEEAVAPLTALKEGVNQMSAGVVSVNDGLKAIAPEAAKLADGQAQLADGLAEALGSLGDVSLDSAGDDEPIPSFASPEHAARSVQFVYMTEAIAVKAETAEIAVEEAPQGFWNRLVDLFK